MTKKILDSLKRQLISEVKEMLDKELNSLTEECFKTVNLNEHLDPKNIKCLKKILSDNQLIDIRLNEEDNSINIFAENLSNEQKRELKANASVINLMENMNIISIKRGKSNDK